MAYSTAIPARLGTWVKVVLIVSRHVRINIPTYNLLLRGQIQLRTYSVYGSGRDMKSL